MEPVAPIVERLALRRLDADVSDADAFDGDAFDAGVVDAGVVDADVFEGRHPQEVSKLAVAVPGRPDAVHVFGGLILAQALRAAQLTVAGGAGRRGPVSLHAAFLRAGRAEHAFRYAVERTRDGRAFSARRVVASQRGEAVLVLQASFQADESGEEYQPPIDLAGVPQPDELAAGRYDGSAFECRDVPVGVGPPAAPHVRRMWFRARGRLPDDPDLHVWALACATDHGPTRAVREPHAGHPGVSRRHSVSLDHSVWFHRPARVDEWLLSELWPVSTGSARGLCTGSVYTATGLLVASVSQQALLRLPD